MDTSHYKSVLQQWASRYELPLYLQPGWLDAVCTAGSWGVCLIDEQDIKAATVWYMTRKWGLSYITHPPLTAFAPVWILFPAAENMKENRRTAIEYRVMADLIRQFPRFTFFKQNYGWPLDNWLPFYWQGFQQTTKYTYIIDDLSDPDALFRRMEQSARTDIRKAQELVSVQKTDNISLLYELYQNSFARQGLPVPLHPDTLSRADNYLTRNHQRTIYLAVDDSGRTHAGLYMAWDGLVARCILSGTHAERRSSGALYLLFWQAMQDCCGRFQYLDLEGSMHEPIERMLRSLGGIRKPYLCINKSKFKWLGTIREIF